jgi:hypothetical protein
MLALTLVAVGCTTGSQGPGSEEQISSTVGIWSEGLQQGDVDKMLSVMSDDFRGSEGADKNEFKRFITGMINDGTLSDIDVESDKANATIDGNTAKYSPVYVNVSQGQATLYFKLKRDGLQWRISGMSTVY